MSREERRAYRRMTRNQDPYAAPPMTAGARARAEAQQRARRGSRRPETPADTRVLSGRMLWWLIGGAVVAFLLGLSLAWPNGPSLALLVGAAAGVGWIVLLVAFAVWRRQQRRSASQRTRGPAGR